MKIIFGRLNVEYDFINITESTVNLRAFLKMRDEDPLLVEFKNSGGLGVPFFIKDDKRSLDINEALLWEGFSPVAENELKRLTEECSLLFK